MEGAPTSPPAGEYTVYPSAIIFAALSLLVALLITPPFIWHARNQNAGAATLVLLAIMAIFQNFVNAIIWPNDDLEHWYSGAGFCDLQVNYQTAMHVAFPASVCCILRDLANAMDTNRSAWNQSTAQKRRIMLVDIIICLILPLLQMPLHYVVQPFRYYIYGIAGCQSVVDGTWLYFVLLVVPQLIWFLAAAYYAVVILIRLLKYRMAFNSILAHTNTTKSRFLRLYILCGICTFGLLILESFVLYQNGITGLKPYSWSATHNSNNPPWNSVVMVQSFGTIYYDRIVWLGGGFIIFLLFGFGRDAVKMYRTGLLAMGLGRVFPSLHNENTSKGSFSTTLSSISSKAKLFFKRGSATSSSGTDTTTSSNKGTPKKPGFLSTISEESRTRSSRSTWRSSSRWTAPFHKKQPENRSNSLLLDSMSGTPSTIKSNVSALPPSPTTAHVIGKDEVHIKKEVRQASETAETLPAKAYEGV